MPDLRPATLRYTVGATACYLHSQRFNAGLGVSVFMKMPYKDTHFFAHVERQPERYYPRALGWRSATQAPRRARIQAVEPSVVYRLGQVECDVREDIQQHDGDQHQQEEGQGRLGDGDDILAGQPLDDE